MKFLTFTDLHEDRKRLQELVARASKSDIDFVICAGDLSTFGRGLEVVLKAFNNLGKKFYVLPGNHEEHLEMEDILKDYPHCVFLHHQAIKIEDYIFLGYGGGGFAQEDAVFRKISRGWYGKYNGKKLVFVTHMPPFGNKTDLLHHKHVGSKDYRKFIERIKPKLVICGHLHETVGEVDKIATAKVVNPGWNGMVIELK
ncbi:MAG: metallophosphoesterase [Nanoarchaeota archaeon]|nr:metallophosphoesterase [Nanoarchaeota archaeon]